MGFSFLSVRLCFSCWFRISVIPKSSIMQDICMSRWVSLSRNYSYSQGCTGWSWHSSTRLSHVKISQRFYCNEILFFFFIFIECSFSFIFLHHPLQAVTKVGMLINVINSHFHIASQRMHSKLRDKKKRGGIKRDYYLLIFSLPFVFLLVSA